MCFVSPGSAHYAQVIKAAMVINATESCPESHFSGDVLTYGDENGQHAEGAEHGPGAARERRDDDPQRRHLAENAHYLPSHQI